MTTGTELTTFITGLNADAAVDPTLLGILVQTAQTIIEEEREWVCLRKVSTALTLTTSNGYTTAKALSGITDFSRFFGDAIITLFDGNDRLHYYRKVPIDRQLEYKDDNTAFWHDANSGNLYFGGTPPFAGTLYMPYISASAAVDPTSGSAVWTVFPSRFLPLLGFYAIGIHKGAVDYDSINREMLPSNQAVLAALKNALEKWDDKLQLSDVDHNDPTELHMYPRGGAINRNG